MSQKEREVWEACDSLLKEGKKLSEITIEMLGIRLRDLNYLRGGNTSLIKYRKTWMEQQGFKETDKEKDMFSVSAASESVRNATERFQRSVEEELKKEYANQFQELLDKEKASEEERLALQEAIAQLTEQHIAQAVTLTQTIGFLQEKEEALSISENALDELTVRFEEQGVFSRQREEAWASEREMTHTNHQLEMNRLSDELYKQREQHNQALQMLMDNQEAQRHQSMVEKDELKTELKKLQKMIEESKTQEHLLKRELQQTTQLYATLEEKSREKQVQLQADHERIAVISTENTQLRESQVTLQKTYLATVSELQKTIVNLQTGISQLASRWDTLYGNRPST
jgi:hypothetical protein